MIKQFTVELQRNALEDDFKLKNNQCIDIDLALTMPMLSLIEKYVNILAKDKELFIVYASCKIDAHNLFIDSNVMFRKELTIDTIITYNGDRLPVFTKPQIF